MSNQQFNIDSKLSGLQNAGTSGITATDPTQLAGGLLPTVSTGAPGAYGLIATFSSTGSFVWNFTGPLA
jgi:hypothetical protein